MAEQIVFYILATGVLLGALAVVCRHLPAIRSTPRLPCLQRFR